MTAILNSITGSLYGCTVKNSLIIDSPSKAQINSVTGTHTGGKSDNDVAIFLISSGPIQYFPRGMDKFFKNLIGIGIYSTTIKEIHQDDLKPYTKLQYLDLLTNNIEVLNDGLFDYNPEMVGIRMDSLKISQIGMNVFGHLQKLLTLHFCGNVCTGRAADNSRTGVLGVLESVKATCGDPEFTKLEEKIKVLEAEAKNLKCDNLQTFNQNRLNFETELKSSKFASSGSLLSRFKILKDVNIEEFHKQKCCQKCCKLDEYHAQNLEKFNNITKSINILEISQTTSFSLLDEKMLRFDENLQGFFYNLNSYNKEMSEKITIIGQKMENFDNMVGTSETNVTEVADKMEQDFEITRKVLFKTLDTKIEELEKRLIKKIENIVGENIKKVLNAIKSEY